MTYERAFLSTIRMGLSPSTPVTHVLIGPRQVGKTTIVRQVQESIGDQIWWGRLVENAVGAHLCNNLHFVEYQMRVVGGREWSGGRGSVVGWSGVGPR